MIEVKQTIEIVEENGKQWPEGEHIVVSSHWNHDEWVILKVGKREFAVLGRDLTTAIENATNINRF